MKNSYSISKILDKINNNEKLSDGELTAMTNYEKNKLDAKYFELTSVMTEFYSDNFFDELLRDFTSQSNIDQDDVSIYEELSNEGNVLKSYLSLLACSMNFIKPYEYLYRTTSYMLSTFGTHTKNVMEARKNGQKYSNSPSYYNRVNFIKEAEEIFNYDSLIGDLHEELDFNVTNDICAFENNICEDEINALEESKAKVLKIRKKYI